MPNSTTATPDPTMVERNLRNRLLANIVPWLSEENPGLRVNWNKTLYGFLMLLVFILWNATSASISIPAALICTCLIVLVTVATVKYFREVEDAFDYEENFCFPKGWVIGMIAIGVLVCLAMIFLIDGGLHYVWSGFLMLAFLVCLVGVSVTRWWPFSRGSWNHDRIQQKPGNKRSHKTEA
jgi:hypothetical protein